MKRIFSTLAIVIIFFTASGQENSVYLDLTKDQVKSGGLDKREIKAYLKKGFKLKSFTVDTTTKVEFLGADGKKYYKKGIIKAGTKYLTSSKLPKKYLILGCGNWGGY